MDLTTTYLGLQLKNPLVASASTFTKKTDQAKRLEEAGLSAIVMHSLFEEQIIHESLELDHFLSHGTETFAEALTYLPDIGTYSIGPDAYIEQLAEVKQAVSIPVIGSLNGVSTGGWIHFAKEMEQAGADALELNIYFVPVDLEITSSQLEDAYIKLVSDIRQQISIPIAVKLSPFFTALPHFANRLVEAGANGLVFFNRFYQPDFDLEELEVYPNIMLSTPYEMRLPLRWIALLYGRINTDFALTSGIHSAEDAIKAMMAGAKVAMMTSALLRNGIQTAAEILEDMRIWLEEHEYESIQQMQGSMSQQAVAEPSAFERANYMKVLSSFGDGREMPHTAISSRIIHRTLSSSADDDPFWSS
ncbi:MAG: dihydroorotate dehydrogenase-like protein [Chloroflexaceae bacterium]|nr:dihydroorotate dehydrogenase-like protein [Chloroflexaceae bacterium]